MRQTTLETTNFLTNEDASDLAAFLFDDLTLPETEANDVKGGRDLTAAPPPPPQPCIGCTWGPPVLNHNETVAEDEAASDELDDLLLTTEQETGIKGGCYGCTWGPPVLNHNETVAEDEVAAPETLTDLRLTDAELDGIKGGPVCHGTTVLAWARVDGVSPQSNHNETVAEDSTQAGEVEDLPLTAIQEQDVKAGGWGSSPSCAASACW